MPRTETEKHLVPTRDGWTLVAHRVVRPGSRGLRPVDGPPIVFVPGYGMNTSILGYHPDGRSFMEALAESGMDVWAVDLRGMTGTLRGSGSRSWGLAEHAFGDVPAALDYVAAVTGHSRMDVIGCSLGGSLLFAYAARFRGGRIDRMVAMGSPLRYVRPSLPVAAVGLFGDPISFLPFRGTRKMARVALPLLAKHAPKALSIYMNAEIVDLGAADELCAVVEDPRIGVNRDIVHWIRHGRLIVDGLDVADALSSVPLRLLVVVAEGDGICNPDSCRNVASVLEPGLVDELSVGGADLHVAHADLFVSAISDERVFKPVVRWLNTGSLEA